MKKIFHLYVLLTLVVLGLSTAGCSQKQKIHPTQPNKVITTAKTVEAVMLNEPKFQTAEAKKTKITLDYQQRKISSAANITICYDSVIIVSVQPMLNIELIRLEVSKQKVLMVDKLNRRYYEVTYQEFEQLTGLPVAYSDIQALLTQHIFAVGRDSLWLVSNQLESEVLTDTHKLLFADKNLRYSFTISGLTNHILETELSLQAPEAKLSANYSRELLVDGVVFPTIIQLNAATARIDGQCTVEMNDIKFNRPVNISSTSLQRLQKVDLKTIIPM